ncbi:MAG: preprotein translocase subunit SecG [Cyclobacteriaceae bacterium]|mgnify:CR=1 FL=1|nr:preprotein translocase subunit SecG [Cyclobacteriaceae bacterium]UYN85271.1 MAG: preprotein translocase subunit SecG [Cyclobacteriaceae bacterium]
MFSFIVGLIIFVSFLLVVVILAQNSKGGGLSSQFGGSGAANIIGVKKTGDLLERLTWGFVVTIMVLSLTLSTNLVTPSTRSGNDILDKAGEQAAPASTPAIPTEQEDNNE